jgi:hypothetical protein
MSFKEPCYFSDDFPGYRFVNSMEDYLGLFMNASKDHLALGEGSVWYLYSSVAIHNIYQFNKNSKIIVMLRNPVDLVYSLYAQLFHLRYENENKFEIAWRLQALRQKGHKIPKHCRDKDFLQYAKIGKLGAQVERLLNIFPKKQIKFIIFDDFIKDTAMIYKEVISFLEIPVDKRSSFLPVHQSRRHRFHWLGTFIGNPPPLIFNIKNRFKIFFGIENLRLLEITRKINTIPAKRKPLSAEFKAELISEFKDDVAKLSMILKRDLNYWCK